jgi:hypothetical protein
MADAQDATMDRAEIATRRDKDALLDALDTRLEHYLHTMHEYHEVMQQLSRELSLVSNRHAWGLKFGLNTNKGYMSLAQANFHNSSSAIRYGQDCYDERMQAIRKV